MKKLLMLMVLIPMLMGSDCEVSVLPEDRKLTIYTTDWGEEVDSLPNQIPWIVVADDSVEDPEWLDNVIAQMNEWHAPHVLLVGGVDQELFDSLWYLDPEDRQGYILFWVGALPDPQWDFFGGEPGPGGIASLYHDDYGVIHAVDIVIDWEHAYHRDTFERRSIHEFGHSVGYEHDDYSLDMGSCMSSPPPYGCRILADDVDYWIAAWEVSNR